VASGWSVVWYGFNVDFYHTGNTYSGIYSLFANDIQYGTSPVCIEEEESEKKKKERGGNEESFLISKC
jgi:hypothetical protein